MCKRLLNNKHMSFSARNITITTKYTMYVKCNIIVEQFYDSFMRSILQKKKKKQCTSYAYTNFHVF